MVYQTKMPIMEIFGPTIQGEGSMIGTKTMFVRTGGCDYRCAWCDSSFTWDGSEKATLMTPELIWKEILSLGSKDGRLNFEWVTLTGGNPALQREAMSDFIDLLHKHGVKVQLETQGSLWRDWLTKVDEVVISPKPPSSKMNTNFNVLDSILRNLEIEKVSLKVVVFDDADYEYAKSIHKRYPHIRFFLSVGNEDAKEEGDISGRLLKKLGWLWDKVLADDEMNDVRPLPQLHTLVWANKRRV